MYNVQAPALVSEEQDVFKAHMCIYIIYLLLLPLAAAGIALVVFLYTSA